MTTPGPGQRLTPTPSAHQPLPVSSLPLDANRHRSAGLTVGALYVARVSAQGLHADGRPYECKARYSDGVRVLTVVEREGRQLVVANAPLLLNRA